MIRTSRTPNKLWRFRQRSPSQDITTDQGLEQRSFELVVDGIAAPGHSSGLRANEPRRSAISSWAQDPAEVSGQECAELSRYDPAAGFIIVRLLASKWPDMPAIGTVGLRGRWRRGASRRRIRSGERRHMYRRAARPTTFFQPDHSQF